MINKFIKKIKKAENINKQMKDTLNKRPKKEEGVYAPKQGFVINKTRGASGGPGIKTP